MYKCLAGEPSVGTNHLMDMLDRPLKTSSTASDRSVLFGTNFEVDCHNANELSRATGELKTYSSEDEGDQKYLRKITANKKLVLKVGVPVMLLRNLSHSLVNGLLGKVVLLEDDGPSVQFENQVVKLKKVAFSVFDPSQCRTIAQRQQYPIQLAFALTIHKSQGLTLPHVIVDCKNIFQAGQLGVSVGRCTSLDGLWVKNYSPKVCKPHPKAVTEYCSTQGIPPSNDHSCCQKVRM